MAISVNPRGLTFYVASNATVAPVTDFNSDRSVEPVQSVDKGTGLKLWSLNVELITDAGVEVVKLKIASNNAPVVAPRSEYVLDGDSYLLATPYIIENAGKSPKQGVSYKLVGALKLNAPVRPVAPVTSITKD